jgi:hypothetical protein
MRAPCERIPFSTAPILSILKGNFKMKFIFRKIREVLERNRIFSTIYHEFRLQYKRIKNKDVILVYQMGKVGSRTIVDSLKEIKINKSIYHVHFLNNENIKKSQNILKNIYGFNFNVNKWCLYESNFIKKFILNKNRNIYIISLVREPISRNISSFFFNIEKFIPNCVDLYNRKKISLEHIKEIYFEKFHEHDLPLTWFDTEMKEIFKINIFSIKNTNIKEKGYFIIKYEDINIMIIRTENIDNFSKSSLKEFLGIKEIFFKKSNSSIDKKYFDLYQNFIDYIIFPSEYLEKMYSSNYAKFFYSADEIEAFKKKWLRK